MIDLRLESEGSDGWDYLVRVAEGAGQTEHRVHLAEADYQRLTATTVSPDMLLQRMFEFLLVHEPKESILRQFDLAVVSRYFPDFESVIRWRFKSSVCRAANTNGW
jgi:hypothetical protein